MNGYQRALRDGNPHNIIADPKAWAQHEYRRGMGSSQFLTDYAKRYGLVLGLEIDSHVPESVRKALIYLLESD